MKCAECLKYEECRFKYELRSRRRRCEIAKEKTGGKTRKKLFISQPMRGKTDEEILAVRAQAVQSAERVLGEEVEVIDSFFKDAVVPSTVLSRPLWFPGESLKLLSGADVAYFAEGWEDARGCRIEHECAVEYGITTIEDYRRSEKKVGRMMDELKPCPFCGCHDYGRCVDCIVREDFFCADGVKREEAKRNEKSD